jgi:putative hydrolase of the HAD superfamily
MIFFDLDDTLISFKDSQRIGALAFWDTFQDNLSYERDPFPVIWNDVTLKHRASYMSGGISYLEYRRRRMRDIFSNPALMDSDADDYFSVYVHHFENSWTLYDDVSECIESLKGYRLGIITNGEGDSQRQKLARFELTHYFDPIICAGEINLWKPDPELFREACKQANVDPKDCVYIGDDYECDYIAAREAGLKSIWLNRDGVDTPEECEGCLTRLDSLHTTLKSMNLIK